jgi:type I restriction enzyme, S subunit
MASGHTPSRKHPEYWGGEIPWIGIRDAKAHHGEMIEETFQNTNELGIENSSARILPTGTVCLSRTASVGYVVVMGRPMATSQDFANWTCSDALLPPFLKYLLLAEQKSFLRFASGTTHQTIYYPELKAFHVCLPSREEQKRIVAILDDAFAGIDAAVANTEKSLTNARKLFDSYLDLIVTRRSDAWVDGRLSEIVGTVSTGPFGSLLHKRDYVVAGTPLVNPANIVGGRVVPDERKTVDQPALDRLGSYVLRPGDIVIGRRGEMGRCAVITEAESGWLCGTGSFFIRPLPSVDPNFAGHLLRSPTYRAELERIATGATMKNLSNKALSRLRISRPPIEEQREINKRLDQLAAQLTHLEAGYCSRSAALSVLKQSILQKAFAGELTAKEAERQMAVA